MADGKTQSCGKETRLFKRYIVTKIISCVFAEIELKTKHKLVRDMVII